MLTRSALILALSGGGVLAQQDDPVDATMDAPSTEGSEATPAVEDSSLPSCTALTDRIAEPDVPVGARNCSLDEAGTILAFAYTGSATAPILTITQSQPEGGERLVSDPIRIGPVTQAPQLTDKNADDSFELFLPVNVVGDETLFELWMPGPDFFFERRDEIIATSPDAIEQRGPILVLTSPGDTPETSVETAMILDFDGLTDLYRVAIDTAAQTCTLLGDGDAATVNAALIEADCADRQGFAPPETPTAPEISPKAI